MGVLVYQPDKKETPAEAVIAAHGIAYRLSRQVVVELACSGGPIVVNSDSSSALLTEKYYRSLPPTS